MGYGVAGLMGVHNRWASKAAYADKEIAHTRARVQIAPLASAFTLHTEATSTPLALPEPIEVIKPMAEWMAWIDEQPSTHAGCSWGVCGEARAVPRATATTSGTIRAHSMRCTTSIAGQHYRDATVRTGLRGCSEAVGRARERYDPSRIVPH